MKPPTTSAPFHAYVGLGSNLGDRAGNLLLAVRGLLEAGLIVSRLSSIYETEPVPVLNQPAFIEMPLFLNMVAELRVPMPAAEQILAHLQRIEHSLGRTREVPGGPRTIDLDLLIYGHATSQTPFLTVPHPRLFERRFVLVPLVELAPQFVHPSLQKSFTELLSETEDQSQVTRWTP